MASPRLTLPLFFFLAFLATAYAAAATPSPAPGVRFQIPLNDGSTATAVILPAENGRSHLVYATSTGQIIFLALGTQDVDPIPPPPPPGRRRIVIVEDPAHTTQAQRQILADKVWRDYATSAHDFLGLIPSDLIDPNTNLPPPHLAVALKAAAGQPLPRVLIFDQTDTLLFSSPLPTSREGLLLLLKSH